MIPGPKDHGFNFRINVRMKTMLQKPYCQE
jgi:hypothetical protein